MFKKIMDWFKKPTEQKIEEALPIVPPVVESPKVEAPQVNPVKRSPSKKSGNKKKKS